MGVWGTAIFSDDTAADVRETFKDFAAEGLSPLEATERLVAESADILTDEIDSLVFWLALAATQRRLGRLVDNVRDRAIRIIDSGGDLHRWQESSKSEIGQRRKHLEKLREQLLSPPLKQTKLKPRLKSTTDFLPGDIGLYRLDDQVAVRFCVLSLFGDRGGTYADICLLGLDTPERFKKRALALADTLGPHFTMLHHEPLDRIAILRRGVKLPERNKETFGAWNRISIRGYACRWDGFPAALQNVLPKLGWI